MANTYSDYTATTNQTAFSFTFPVLLPSHVVVEINNVAKTYNTDYIVNKTAGTVTLQLGGVVGTGATAGDVVRVRRVSDPATDLVDFADGSRLSSTRLDLSYQHNRYLSEEASEISDGSISETTLGGVTFLDAAQRPIRNLPAPTVDHGAATKVYVDQRTALTTTNLTAFGQDDYTGDGTTTVFNFNNISPQVTESKAFLVNIDGITQSPSNYTITLNAGAPNTITFSTAPVNGSVINVVTLAGAASVNFPATTNGTDVTFTGTIIATNFQDAAGQGLLPSSLTVPNNTNGELCISGAAPSITFKDSGNAAVGGTYYYPKISGNSDLGNLNMDATKAGAAIRLLTQNVSRFVAGEDESKDANGTASAGVKCTNDIYAQGDISADGDVVASLSSDKNLKDDIKPIESPLEKIKELSGNTFTWNEQATRDGEDVGVIAQEVQKLFPSAVKESSDGYLKVEYSKVIPLLIECIKELNNKLESK